MKRASVLFAFLLVVTGLLAGRASAVSISPGSADRLSTLEQSVLSRLNAVRASHGVRPLVLSNGLEEAALTHSQSMLEAGFFEHESRDGLPFSARIRRYYAAAGFDNWTVGENLLSTTGEASAASVIRAWLSSPAHRRNMLSPTWREVGIGALHTSSAGGTFGGAATAVVTMDFGTRSAGRSRLASSLSQE